MPEGEGAFGTMEEGEITLCLGCEFENAYIRTDGRTACQY